MNNREEYKKSMDTALMLTAFLTAPAAIYFMFFSRDGLTIIFEHGSAVVGCALLAALAPGVLFIGHLTIFNTALEAKGRVATSVVSLVSGTLIKCILTSFLITNEKIGILAAPIGTSVSYFVSLLISTVALKEKDIKIKDLYLNLIKPIICSSISAVLVLVLKYSFQSTPESRAFSIVVSLCYGIIYVGMLLLLSKNARKNILKLVKFNKKAQNIL